MEIVDVLVDTKRVPHKDDLGEDFMVEIKRKDNKAVILHGKFSLSFPRSDIRHGHTGIDDIEKLETVAVDLVKGIAIRENPNFHLRFDP